MTGENPPSSASGIAVTGHIIGPRLPDWEDRLGSVIIAAGAKPFAWGHNDCLMLAGGVIDALMGTDPAHPFRGRYRTATGATRAMRGAGWPDVAAALDAHLPRGLPSHARRGDIVVFDGAAGVVFGGTALFFAEDAQNSTSDAGILARVPMGEWVAAWRVGD